MVQMAINKKKGLEGTLLEIRDKRLAPVEHAVGCCVLEQNISSNLGAGGRGGGKGTELKDALGFSRSALLQPQSPLKLF